MVGLKIGIYSKLDQNYYHVQEKLKFKLFKWLDKIRQINN